MAYNLPSNIGCMGDVQSKTYTRISLFMLMLLYAGECSDLCVCVCAACIVQLRYYLVMCIIHSQSAGDVLALVLGAMPLAPRPGGAAHRKHPKMNERKRK
jgi:hypothetical protein